MKNIFKLILSTIALSSFCDSLIAAEITQVGNSGFIKLSGEDVHPTHILAKIKSGIDKELVIKSLNAKNYLIKRKYRLVDGLLLIDTSIINKKQAVFGGVLKRCINELKSSGWFVYVEPDKKVTLYKQAEDEAYVDGRLWGLLNTGQNGGTEDADIDADIAWDSTTGNRQIIVSVIDTGVRYTHNDLKNQMWVNEDEIPSNGIDDDNDGWVDNVYGIDPSDNDGDPNDFQGHGTHCAGTIGAEANNGFPHVGVAWDVRLMAVRNMGGSNGITSASITGIEFSVENGATVANCSWGGTGTNAPLYDAFQAGGEKGMLFSCASGNMGMDNDSIPDWPSGFDLECVIAVAASDKNDMPAVFTNYGKTTVDLAAPGVDIYSSVSTDDDAYSFYDGTSMAGPHVAGVIALMQGLEPNWSVLQIRERLLESVDVLDSMEGLVATSGRVNAAAAVEGLGSGSGGIPDGNMEISVKPSSGNVLLAGSNAEMFVTVIDGEPVDDAVVIGIMDDGAELYFNNDGDFPDVKESDNIYSYYLPLPEEPRKLKLTLIVTAPGKQEYVKVLKYDIVPIPENDNFNNAYKLSPEGEVVEAFNTFATIEKGEKNHAKAINSVASLWWNWSPASDGLMHVDVSGSEIDAALAVYYGPSVDNLIEISNNSPIKGKRENFIQFQGYKGKTYRIVVAGVTENDLSYIRLRTEVNGQPDINAPYVKITSPPNGFLTEERRVLIEGLAVDPSPNSSGISEVTVNLNNSSAITAVGSDSWSIPLLLIEGINKITVQARDYSNNLSKKHIIEIDYKAPDVPNDHFANAIQMNKDVIVADGKSTQYTLSQPISDKNDIIVSIDGLGIDSDKFRVQEFNDRIIIFDDLPPANSTIEVFHPKWTSNAINTEDATVEIGEPLHAGNEGGGSVWWEFTAPYDGNLTVSTINTKIDTVLGAYTGSRVNNLRLVTSNDDDSALLDLEDNPGFSKISQSLLKGMKIMIAADGFANVRGELSIKTSFNKTQVYKLEVVNGIGGEITKPWLPFGNVNSGLFGLYSENENIELLAKPSEGNIFYGWSSFVNSLENPLSLTITGNLRIVSSYGPELISDDFESGGNNLPWEFSGDSNWFIQNVISETGNYSIQTGKIRDNQISKLKLTSYFKSGEGSFSVKLDSEKNWDKLNFYIDGRLIQSWSGEVSWSKYDFSISKGKHTLEWIYQKDFANSSGLDAAWLDNVDLPIGLNASLAIVKRDNQNYIKVWGAFGHRYILQSSNNFINWKTEESFVIDNNGFKDILISPSKKSEFFRVLAP